MQTAPANSPLTCIGGTDRGIVQLQNDKLAWITPTPPRRKHRQRREHDAPDATLPPWQTNILSVDFLPSNPASLIAAGTRSGYVCLLDTRTPPHEWTVQSNTFKHPSSIAHLRAVGPYELLAAGPRNAMAVYDIRYLQQQQQQPPSQPSLPQRTTTTTGRGKAAKEEQWNPHPNPNATLPLLTFPSYRNEAHIQFGLDVLTHPGYGPGYGYGGGGIVAAAHDDSTVGVYSLRDGARIAPAGDVDGIKPRGVVGSLMWQTLAGDRHPCLFVGEGSVVRKYSFWA
jgi:hypothetical protein